MDFNPDDLFRDDDDDPESEYYQPLTTRAPVCSLPPEHVWDHRGKPNIHTPQILEESNLDVVEADKGMCGRESTKEYVVYLVDASPRMFYPASNAEDNKDESPFHVVVSCIAQSLKTQIINNSYDEVSICFFNTREKKNLQDLSGVYVFNVNEREPLDRPTARLIKEFSNIEETFMSEIGSQYGIISGSRENSLYNALWAAQALLRKGSTKNADKRILLFTNEDDPFGRIKGAPKTDMIRTTIQRAKDAQDMGILIELLPSCRPSEEFDVSLFYADLIGLENVDQSQFITSTSEKLDDMKAQLRKRMFKKRKIKRITFSIANGISIELNTYALIRPTVPGAITWLDSVTNLPLKSERSSICADTGALMQVPARRFHPYRNDNVLFTMDELSEIKKVSTGHLRLLGFKPLSCLKDCHNLRPSTFLFPNDEEIIGSTRIFISLHRSMSRLKRFAVAFYGSSANPHLVALIAQDEITSSSGQVEPPGMHMIHLPYSDDIRHAEELHMAIDATMPRAIDDQIKKASVLLKRVDLKDFSVCQFANPALQRHYAILEALALGDDEMPETADETVPDEEGMARPGVVNALEDYKVSVYGENHDQEEAENNAAKSTVSDTAKKRKAILETAVQECANYEWADLADNGKLKDLTVTELKYYLSAHSLPVAGKKEALISRILTHMGK